MSNPPKQKGTGGETELVGRLEKLGLKFVRTPAGCEYDLTNATPNRLELEPLEVLATRPDRGQWLMTTRLDDFAHLLSEMRDAHLFAAPWETHIEAKRYKAFAHHTIFEKKFGGKA